MNRALIVPSPFGPLVVECDDSAITRLDWGPDIPLPDPDENPPEILRAAGGFLERYFAGATDNFDLPVAFPGATDFHQRVWRRMAEIPYSVTETYGALAHDLGSSARAVGGACGANPIPILVPCHRVVAASGKLGGFSAPSGTDGKRQLLALEGALLPL